MALVNVTLLVDATPMVKLPVLVETVIRNVFDREQRCPRRSHVTDIRLPGDNNSVYGRRKAGVTRINLRAGDIRFRLIYSCQCLSSFGLQGLHHSAGAFGFSIGNVIPGSHLVKLLRTNRLSIEQLLVSMKGRGSKLTIGISGRPVGFCDLNTAIYFIQGAIHLN